MQLRQFCNSNIAIKSSLQNQRLHDPVFCSRAEAFITNALALLYIGEPSNTVLCFLQYFILLKRSSRIGQEWRQSRGTLHSRILNDLRSSVFLLSITSQEYCLVPYSYILTSIFTHFNFQGKSTAFRVCHYILQNFY